MKTKNKVRHVFSFFLGGGGSWGGGGAVECGVGPPLSLKNLGWTFEYRETVMQFLLSQCSISSDGGRWLQR